MGDAGRRAHESSHGGRRAHGKVLDTRTPSTVSFRFWVWLEHRWRRAIGGHRRPDLGDPRGPALGEVELLEELAEPAIAISPRDDSLAGQLLPADRRVRPGVADDLDAVRIDPHLDRFSL